jgi:hypothetical protein
VCTGAKIESERAIFSPWESPQKKDGIPWGCWLSSVNKSASFCSLLFFAQQGFHLFGVSKKQDLLY